MCIGGSLSPGRTSGILVAEMLGNVPTGKEALFDVPRGKEAFFHRCEMLAMFGNRHLAGCLCHH